MNVLFISNDPLIFDETSGVRARMRAYAAEIGELHILSRAPHRSEVVHEETLHLYPCTGNKISSLLSMKKKARALIQQERIEVVSAQDPFEHGWVASDAVSGTAAKLHLQAHTDFLSPWFTKNGVFRSIKIKMPFLNTIRVRIADSLIPNADGIRVVSRRIQEGLVARYGEALPSVSVIPAIVSDVVPAPLPLPEPHFAFSLITVSRLEPEKRIEDILMAVGRVARLYPSLGLYVVGEGREKHRLMRLTRELGLEDRVVFLGARNDARALMGSATAYIQASAYEGYGMTLIEAALARIPIITTDVGIVGEVFTGYNDVLSAPPGDPAALAVHIRGLVSDHQARFTLAMNAEAAAKKHLASLPNQPHAVALDLAETAKAR